MQLQDVATFEDLEQFLREFTNPSSEPVPYDFVGAYALFLAILNNIRENHIEADLENLAETPPVLTESQKAFLQRLIQLTECGKNS